ncbi:MAG TPA: phage tail protein [Trinickia sp.]
MADPFRGFRFVLDFTPAVSAAFSEVTIPDITVDTVDYREGSAKHNHRRRYSGLTSYGNVTLRKGITFDLALYKWHQIVVKGGTSAPTAKRTGTITLLDTDGSPGARWTFYGAFPTAYQSGGLNASSAEVMIETLELSIERMERDL